MPVWFISRFFSNLTWDNRRRCWKQNQTRYRTKSISNRVHKIMHVSKFTLSSRQATLPRKVFLDRLGNQQTKPEDFRRQIMLFSFCVHIFFHVSLSIWRDVISLVTDPTKHLAVVAGGARFIHLLAKINPQICRKLNLLITEQENHSWELTNLE